MFHSTPDPQHVESWTTNSGLPVVVRPIRPEDEALMARFHQTLSPESVYTRYFNVFRLRSRTTHERLCRVCHPNPDREAVLVAESATPDGSGREIIAVGRLSTSPGGKVAEVALVVSDSYQGSGIGTELMRRLIEIAKQRPVTRVSAYILAGNVAMQRLCVAAGMRLSHRPGGGEVKAELNL